MLTTSRNGQLLHSSPICDGLKLLKGNISIWQNFVLYTCTLCVEGEMVHCMDPQWLLGGANGMPFPPGIWKTRLEDWWQGVLGKSYVNRCLGIVMDCWLFMSYIKVYQRVSIAEESPNDQKDYYYRCHSASLPSQSSMCVQNGHGGKVEGYTWNSATWTCSSQG